MGAVAEMLRKRERRDASKRASLWDLLWVPPTAFAAGAGVLLLPQTGSRWLDALLWAGYGAMLTAMLLLASRIVHHVRPRASLSIKTPLELIFFMTVVFGLQRLFPERLWGDQGLAILAMSVVGGCILGLAQWLRLRRQRAQPPRAT